MIILGIDPGSRRMGYGVIVTRGQNATLLEAGLVPISGKDEAEILSSLYEGISKIISFHKPDRVCVERLYFAKNQKTAIAVAQARGVALAAAGAAGVSVSEHSPNEVKSATTGDGHADKKAVSKMVHLILHLPDTKLIDDATDAVALALTGRGVLTR